MFYILIDTCVWLDLGKDYHQSPMLGALEELTRNGQVSLILPRTVVAEFARNKSRVIKETGKSLSSTLRRVKEVVDKFGDPKQKKLVLDQLNDVDHKIPALGETAINTFARIEDLFSQAAIIETSDSVKLRAAQRAIDKKAPFHEEKNSIGDAILIESYADFIRGNKKRGNRFAFITHNFKDFSQKQGDQRLPHPDIAGLFSVLKSLYFVTLKDALQRIDSRLLSELIFVQEWLEKPRGITEIVEVINELVTKLWYNRHQVRKEAIEDGRIKILPGDQYSRNPHKPDEILDTIWNGALKTEKSIQKKLGLENLGPWGDFEWGMLNGKLSALQWVLGEEWDNLDI